MSHLVILFAIRLLCVCLATYGCRASRDSLCTGTNSPTFQLLAGSQKNWYTLEPVWLALISAGAGLGNQWKPPSGSTAPVGCYWGYE
jgi:hypothetical protein